MQTSDDRGFAAKHSADDRPDPAVADAVASKAKDGRISCAAAFEIAGRLGADPAAVGKTLDLLNLRLIKCQLGLFGYEPQKKIASPPQTSPPELLEALRGSLQDGRLPCVRAWALAEKFQLPKLRVGGVCEAAGIKIKPCQLGAF